MSVSRIVMAFCVMSLPMSLAVADEFTEQVPVEECRPIRKLIKKLIDKPRKCFKCSGEGHVVMNVKEPCDECEGTGVVITDRQIKDTKHSTDGYWNYHKKTTRTVQNKQSCKKCGRSGKMNVKKEVTCSVCKGAGLLTKSGKPYVAKSNGEQKRDDSESERNVVRKEAEANDDVLTDGEETEKSVTASEIAARIRADKDVKLRANEIAVPGDRGWAEFPYTSNQGIFTITCNGCTFKTKWEEMKNGKVSARRDFVEKVGGASGRTELPGSVADFTSWCWKYKNVIVGEGDVVAFMNEDGRFLAVKIKSITKHGENASENGASAKAMGIEFRCY